MRATGAPDLRRTTRASAAQLASLTARAAPRPEHGRKATSHRIARRKHVDGRDKRGHDDAAGHDGAEACNEPRHRPEHDMPKTARPQRAAPSGSVPLN